MKIGTRGRCFGFAMTAPVVHYTSLLGKLPEFKQEDNLGIFKAKLSLYFIANDVAEGKKIAILLTALDSDVYETLSNLWNPGAPETQTLMEL